MTERKKRRKNTVSQADLGYIITVAKSPTTKSKIADETNSQSTDDDSEYEQNDGSSESDKKNEDKAEKKRLKRERQKRKKLVTKITTQRKASMMILLKDGTISTSTLLLSSPRPVPFISLVPEASISLLRSPLVTANYFLREIRCLLCDAKSRFLSAIFGSSEGRNVGDVLGILAFSVFVGVGAVASYFWRIAEDGESLQIKQDIVWHAYWIVLGILSSIGFGTGLHTFVLYLGPFIAKVTLAAAECSTLNFPFPPYPNQIICPSEHIIDNEVDPPTVWSIMSKVRWESVAWGFGTALGELPPYFMAKASQLYGSKLSFLTRRKKNKCKVLRKLQKCLRRFLKGIGFWGILLCASIPNPLFDLAGITCGHFRIPFMTFFGATVIGKSIVKSQLQTILAVLAFNEDSLKSVLGFMGTIPHVGGFIQREFTEFMDYQKSTVHEKRVAKSGGILKTATDLLAFVMIVYFIISIINGLARRYRKRILHAGQKTRNRNKIRKMRKLQGAQTQL